jgi:hypothetical protein
VKPPKKPRRKRRASARKVKLMLLDLRDRLYGPQAPPPLRVA